MSTDRYTPELHAHLKEVCAAEATNGMSPMFVSLPILMMATPLMVDEIDRLNEQVARNIVELNHAEREETHP